MWPLLLKGKRFSIHDLLYVEIRQYPYRGVVTGVREVSTVTANRMTGAVILAISTRAVSWIRDLAKNSFPETGGQEAEGGKFP